MLNFFIQFKKKEKKKKNTSRYHYQNLDDIYSFWDTKHTEIDNLRSFFAL